MKIHEHFVARLAAISFSFGRVLPHTVCLEKNTEFLNLFLELNFVSNAHVFKCQEIWFDLLPCDTGRWYTFWVCDVFIRYF